MADAQKPKVKLSEIRAQFPMYAEVSDEKLLAALHKKYYADMPRGNFLQAIDYDTSRIDPTADMNWGEKFAAGMGKSAVDLGRTAKRLGNMVGLGSYDQAAAAEDQRLDQDLMNTGAGTAGKLVGDLATTLVPGMGVASRTTQGVTKLAQAGRAASGALPKTLGLIGQTAAPYLGAMTSGALQGMALSPDDLSGGFGRGAAAGGIGEGAGRVLRAVGSGTKALIEPLYEQGREKVLKRTLERFATNPAAARAAAANPQVLVPGTMPSLAEATMDPGLAQLQRGAMTSTPVASALAQGNQGRVAAYKGVLDDLAGNDGKRAFYEAERKGVADQLYGKAFQGGLKSTPEVQQQFGQLMARPSVQSALPRARQLALESGHSIDNPAGSVAGLHHVKTSIDDLISEAQRAGRDNEARAILGTKDQLVNALREASPAYGEALDTYAAMSRPLNQMAVGQSMRDKLVPALADYSDDLARTRADTFARALREGDKTAQQATGLSGATMAGTMEPAQIQALEGIARDAARKAAADEIGRVPGSPTAQYLGAQNVMRQFLGPLGMPQDAMDGMLGRGVSNVLNLPFKGTQSQTEELLGKALADPRVAARIWAVKDDPSRLGQLLERWAAQGAIQAQTID